MEARDRLEQLLADLFDGPADETRNWKISELLRDEIHLVRGLRAREQAGAPTGVAVHGSLQAGGGPVQGLVPRGDPQLTAVANHRFGEPREPVRHRCSFRADRPNPAAESFAELGSFDLILCRNVLIYFRDAIIARVLDAMTGLLAPGGVIAVGVSESLLRFGSSLVSEERGGSFFYRKAR